MAQENMHLAKVIEQIRCVICDLDGVLTDGALYLSDDSHEFKRFHVHDGLGLKLLIAAGIEVAVITTSRNAVVEQRMQQLGITHFFTGQVSKTRAFDELKTRLNLNNQQFAYIGDDLPDIAVMQQVGLSVAVANAQPEVKRIATWQTTQIGGYGAVREVCNLILNTHHTLDAALASYLNT
tara:strand:- start:1361 stop:1900 length:540 start_codon:yes stop_codon:yes gene_type:complete